VHSVRVPMWQTQSVGPVRTAHVGLSVLLTSAVHSAMTSVCTTAGPQHQWLANHGLTASRAWANTAQNITWAGWKPNTANSNKSNNNTSVKCITSAVTVNRRHRQSLLSIATAIATFSSVRLLPSIPYWGSSSGILLLGVWQSLVVEVLVSAAN